MIVALSIPLLEALGLDDLSLSKNDLCQVCKDKMTEGEAILEILYDAGVVTTSIYKTPLDTAFAHNTMGETEFEAIIALAEWMLKEGILNV